MSTPGSLPPAESRQSYPPPPVTRRGLLLRFGACLLPALAFGGMAASSATWRPRGGEVAINVIGFLAAAVLIMFRRRRPRLVVYAMATMSLVAPFSTWFFPWALASLSTRRRWKEVLPAALYSWGVSIAGAYTPWANSDAQLPVDGSVSSGWSFFLIISTYATLWIGGIVALGFYIGARRELVASLTDRAETAEREQQLKVEAAKATERARIAREMHDVLAHRISLVSMHAGVLAYRDDLLPEESREIAGIIQENAHASLTELRQVLSSLREVDSSVEKPQPTLGDLADLIGEVRAAGTEVEVGNELAEAVPPTLARHVYRMLQESLTNARKHAAGAKVTIRIWGSPRAGLSLEVRNPLTEEAGVPGSGLGLVGLQERADLLKGRFEAKADGGQFVVRAWLPWRD